MENCSQNGPGKSHPRGSFLHLFRDLVFYVVFMLNWAHFGLPFGALWLTLGSLWLTFGSLLVPFGSLLVPLDSLLVPLSLVNCNCWWHPISHSTPQTIPGTQGDPGGPRGQGRLRRPWGPWGPLGLFRGYSEWALYCGKLLCGLGWFGVV